MRSNFAPLYRSSIGFDRIFDLLENNSRDQASQNWPPYDIAKTGDDTYRISLAVAGFTQDELEISSQPNLLAVSGKKKSASDGAYLHHGIASRPFTHRFELAEHVKVTGARLANGLLIVDLRREIPEEMRPRRIEIAAAGLQPQPAPSNVDQPRRAA